MKVFVFAAVVATGAASDLGNETIQNLSRVEGVGSCGGKFPWGYQWCDEPKGSMWCWAAAATEIATHFAYPQVQCRATCQVVGHKRGGQNCCGNRIGQTTDACWNQQGNGNDVANSINWATGGRVTYSYYHSSVAESDLRRYLLIGPVALYIQWYGGGGHFITVVGCDAYGRYYVHDTTADNHRADYHLVSYNQLVTYVFPGSTSYGRWSGIVYKSRYASSAILNDTEAISNETETILNEAVIVV